jgi:hypothetical protein
MHESETCLAEAARSGDERSQLVARRILSNVHLWSQWELEHTTLVRSVARHTRPQAQTTALRSGALGLIHRKALFEYLRAAQLREPDRRRVIKYFRGTLHYTDAIVSEHGQYLRSAGSHLCVHHLGVTVLLDGVFQGPVERYEALYTEYFKEFCETLIAGANAQAAADKKSILPLLKHQVSTLHAQILALPRTEPDLDYEALIRRPTGDTQKLKRPAIFDLDIGGLEERLASVAKSPAKR